MSSLRTTERLHLGRFLELFVAIPVKTRKKPVKVRALRNMSPAGPKVSTMAVLYPSMVEGHQFRSWFRYMKMSETCFTESGEMHLIFSAPFLKLGPLDL